MKLNRFLSTVLLSLTFASPSRAAILFNNLSQPTGASSSFGNTAARWASDFLTDGAPSTLTSITAFMGSSANNSITVTFSIFTDSGGSPGALVRAFDTSPSLDSDSPTQFPTATSSGGIDLLANTKYWVIGQLNADPILGTVTWRTTTSDEIDDGTFSTVPGTQIHFSGNSGGSYSPSDPGNLLFALDGITPVPEPTGIALLVTFVIFGTSGVFGWWRRRRAALNSDSHAGCRREFCACV